MRTRDGAVGFEGEKEMEKIPHQIFFGQQGKLKTYHFNVGSLGQVKYLPYLPLIVERVSRGSTSASLNLGARFKNGFCFYLVT